MTRKNNIVRNIYVVVITVMFTFALAFLLGAVGLLLDRLSQVDDEWATSQSLIDAQLAGYEQAKKDRAAADVCLSTVGESQPVWDEDGNLFCAPKGMRKR